LSDRRLFLAHLTAIALGVRRAIPGDSLASIEQRLGGRLGVAVLDTHTGHTREYHEGERFPMCSTFKLLAATAVLSRVDAGQEQLDRRIAYSESDLLEYAPVTRAHVREGSMTLDDLCAAAIEQSDNTAANLILGTLSGPSAITAYVRTLGDSVTRLDRTEPTLNDWHPGEERDTTSPAAILGDMRAILTGNVLSPTSRDRLTSWLVASTRGLARIRAGLPSGWRAGDKIGTGRGVSGDLAIAWPPGRRPLLLATYVVAPNATDAQRDAAYADVARFATGTV
jgi:beta-lactamase class A